MIGVDLQSPLERRDGALVTVAPFAYPAGDTDGLERLGRIDVHVIGINERRRVPHLAAKADGIAARGCIERTA